jgi:Cof subfamily protein (haloacid dehalogenase superfamily)
LTVNETIRLVALDLDGTLLNENLEISPRVEAAIRAAQERGVQFTIATGRSFVSSRGYAARLGMTAPLLCFQGGVVGDPVTGEVIYELAMDPAVAHVAVEAAEAEDLDLSLYVQKAVYFRQLRFPEAFYDRWFGMKVIHEPDLHRVVDLHAPLKFIIVAEPPETDVIEARWKERFDGTLHVVRSHRLFIEGNPPGASKGVALAWLAERLGIPQAGVMAVGDNDNDHSMVAWAGVGVAMGNGAPSLQAVANWIAPAQHEDGVAAALEQFVLGRSE